MARTRLFRFRDRASYKPSEVVGLFVLSLFAGGIACLLLAAIDVAIRRFLQLG